MSHSQHFPPEITHDAEAERRVTWLELFYDLVYVAAIIQLGNALSKDVSPVGLVAFVALFIPIWWSWTGITFYINRFVVDDFWYRMLIFVQIGFIAILAMSVPKGFRRAGCAVYLGLRRHPSRPHHLVRSRRPECPASTAANPPLRNRFFDRRRDLVSLGFCTGPGPVRGLGARHDRRLCRAPLVAPSQRAHSTRCVAYGRALWAVYHHRDGRGLCEGDQRRAGRAPCGYGTGAWRAWPDHRRRDVVDLFRQRRRLAGQTGGHHPYSFTLPSPLNYRFPPPVAFMALLAAVAVAPILVGLFASRGESPQLSPAHSRPPAPVGSMSTHRIEALADGVFAIVMTLLVFDLRVPEVSATELPTALFALWPKFLGYATSFVLLGIYWVGHRNQFNFIRRADQKHMETQFNIVLLRKGPT